MWLKCCWVITCNGQVFHLGGGGGIAMARRPRSHLMVKKPKISRGNKGRPGNDKFNEFERKKQMLRKWPQIVHWKSTAVSPQLFHPSFNTHYTLPKSSSLGFGWIVFVSEPLPFHSTLNKSATDILSHLMTDLLRSPNQALVKLYYAVRNRCMNPPKWY